MTEGIIDAALNQADDLFVTPAGFLRHLRDE